MCNFAIFLLLALLIVVDTETFDADEGEEGVGASFGGEDSALSPIY